VADLALTPEQELLRNAARDFIERECPLASVRRIDEEQSGFDAELWRKVAGLGWPGILVAAEHGGEGGSLTDAAVLYEEMGRGLLPGPHHSSAVLCAQIVQRTGSDEQRRVLLPVIASGDLVLALAFTEAEYGWSAEHVRMTAQPSTGGFTLSGTKQVVVDAGAADRFIVVARVGDQPETLTALLVDANAPGVSMLPMRGFLSQPLHEVTFDSVEVPASAVLGGPGDVWHALEASLDVATALLCVHAAGAMRRVYEMTLDYAQRRVQFGQPIARFQRVQDHLVDMLNAADAARWTAYEAIWKLEQGRPDAPLAVSVAKTVASDGFYRACESAHHVHAGIGSDKAYGLYQYTKRSRLFYHYLGDPAHHRRRVARLLEL
jgi:acyl-CoA dehydrogenase